MKLISFQLPSDPNTIIQVGRSLVTGHIRVLVNGTPAEKAGELSRAYLIHLSDGSVKKLEVDRGGFDYVPRVYIDGQRIEIARRLKWFELILGGLPALLILGGVFGAICGIVALTFNFQILRSDRNYVQKALIVAGITILAIIVYLLLVMVLKSIIH